VNRYYTLSFGGTSSASPIVASAAAVLQGLNKQATGAPLPASQLRAALVAAGSPQQSGLFPATQNIGPRPTLVSAAFAVLGPSDCNNTGIPDALETLNAPVVEPVQATVPAVSGQTLALRVIATDDSALTYQWMRGVEVLSDGPTVGGSTISGATTDSMTIASIMLSDAGSYRCVVTNRCSREASADVILTVSPSCRSDVNLDGWTTVQDIFEYLAFYFTGDTRADLDGTSGVSLQDLFTFLHAYFTGC
jgi:hypothetical protein